MTGASFSARIPWKSADATPRWRRLVLGLVCLALAGLVTRAEDLPDSDGDTLPDDWELLYGFDPNEPAGTPLVNPILRAVFETPGYARHVTVQDNLAVVSDGPAGLALVDVTVATNPVQAGALAVPYPQEVRCSTVVSNHVYVPLWGREGWGWSTEIGVYDISDPAQITKVGAVITNGLAWAVAVREDRAYVGVLKMFPTYIGSLPGSVVEVFDVSGPGNPTPLRTLEGFSFAREVRTGGDLLLVADLQSGAALVTLDGASEGPPRHYPLPGWQDGDKPVYSVDVHSNMLYAACGLDGLAVWDINDPENPLYLGAFPLPGVSRSVAVASNLAAVAAGPAGVMILDVTDPAHPVRAGRLASADSAESVALANGLLYVADGSNGLVIAELVDDDTDLDGLSDAWEMETFNSLDMDGSDDPDEDAISNLGEYRAGLDPQNRDQDGDSMDDGWEIAHLLNPWQDDGDDDPDGDGSRNRDEFIAGTNPGDDLSRFEISALNERDPGVIVFRPAYTGRLYSLYGTTNLFQPFVPLATNLTSAPPSGTVTNPLISGDRGFHRVGVHMQNP